MTENFQRVEMQVYLVQVFHSRGSEPRKGGAQERCKEK